MLGQKRFLLAAGTLLMVLVFFQQQTVAQCPMCRTALIVSEEGRQLADGFNRGILFLASVPFLAIGTIAFLIFQSTGLDSGRKSKYTQEVTRRG